MISASKYFNQGKFFQVGDHIEKLNGADMVGKRHFEVAKALKDIPVTTKFVIRLIEPMKSGFTNIAPKSGKTGKKSYGSGKETLRFKADGKAEIEEQVSFLPSKFIFNICSLEKIQNILS